jgi:hypothetical protein
VCKRRSVAICCHDSPHDEAPRPCLRTFHTVSPGTRVNKGEKKAGPLHLAPNEKRARATTPRLSYLPIT